MPGRQHLPLLLFTAVGLIPLTAIIMQNFSRKTSAGASPPIPPTYPLSEIEHSQTELPLQVIVVGSGLAGLVAAICAINAGASRVLILERDPIPGGNSRKASSGISAAGQPGDSALDFQRDTVESAGTRFVNGSPTAQEHRSKLITKLTNQSGDAIKFLEEYGVDLSVVAQLGGHQHARTHRGSGNTPPGHAMITALTEKLSDVSNDKRYSSKIELMKGCEVTDIITAPVPKKPAAHGRPAEPATTKVIGVMYAKKDKEDVHRELFGAAAIALFGQKPPSEPTKVARYGPVVFATGGFAGDHKQLAKVRSDLVGLPSTNDERPGMHELLLQIGAKLVDMDSVQIHPTGFVSPTVPNARVKFLAAELLRGEGGILLHEGRRFINELDTREHISGEIMKLPPKSSAIVDPQVPTMWDIQVLLDQGAYRAAKSHVDFYLYKNLMKRCKVSELHRTTRATLNEYAQVVRRQGPDKLGRTAFGHWSMGPMEEWDDDTVVYVGNVTPVTHFTMGGVVIDENARVLSTELGEEPQKPIPNLFAAGEITGGVHGDNRLGGSSLLECVVFGITAGENAADALEHFEP